MQKFKISILSLFPDMFGALQVSMLGKALEKGLWELNLVQIRDFSIGKHNTVDDTPYGGGAGMLMRPDVIAEAIRDTKKNHTLNENSNSENKPLVVFLTPSGKPFTQEDARRIASYSAGVIMVCGHYEGLDQRAIDSEVDEEISIGDYVLSGGEIPAMVITDAIVRTIPEVLGGEDTLKEESFDILSESGEKLLEYPHYTRPEEWEGQKVPEVLRSGNHGKIAKWRQQKALEKTKKVRADLLKT